MTLESSHVSISQQNISSNDSLLSNTNVTTDPALLQWNALSAFTLMLLITGTLGNGDLLLLFLKDRTLRTPFNVYLINLLTANFVCVIFLYPMDLMANLHSSHWLLGDRACSLYIYTTYVIEAGIFHSHALIAVNRTWALVHPLSYRSFHSGRTAVFLCLGVWIYVNLAVAPEVIWEALYYRLPPEDVGCNANVVDQPIRTYDNVTQILFYNVPHLVMLVTLLVICIASMKQARLRNRVTPDHFSRRATGMKTAAANSDAAAPEKPFSDSRESQSRTAPQQNSLRKSLTMAPRRRPLRGLFLLTLLTISVTICWTPIDVYYTMYSISPGLDTPVFARVAEILFSLQTTIDPILFTLSMRNLRSAIKAQLVGLF